MSTQPPRLSLNEARSRSLIGRLGRALPLDLGAPWLATLTPQPLSEGPAAWGEAWTLEAEWGGARFALRLPSPALALWAEAADGSGVQFGELPHELRALALEAAWRQLAAALSPLKRGSARLMAVHAPDAPAPVAPGPHRIGVELVAPAAGERFDVEVATDALGLLLVGGAVATRTPPPGPQSEPPAEVPVRAQLAIGRAVLPQAEAAALRRGDVVLFAETWLQPESDGTTRLWLATHHAGGLPVRLEGTRVHILQAWSPRPMSPAPDTAAAGPDETTSALDDVPVGLSFDLGELQLPLSELRHLAPGQSFDLGRPLAGAVRVRANGALIGWGELVEIDGRLGVALTQVGPGES